jgi:hypothetical protein
MQTHSVFGKVFSQISNNFAQIRQHAHLMYGSEMVRGVWKWDERSEDDDERDVLYIWVTIPGQKGLK